MQRLSGSTIGFWLITTLLPAAGCDRGGETLVPVEGKVTIAGEPLTAGAVSFRPDRNAGNSSLHHPTGPIDAEGNYRLFVGQRAGAPPGSYQVVVFANEPAEDEQGAVHPGMPKTLIDRRYNAPETTPLSAKVQLDAETQFDFDLEPAR